MWRIKILYKDFSEITLKGIEVDIDYQTAIFYYNNYIVGRDVSTATYQQYPINEHQKYDFAEKIEQLRQADLASHRLQMSPHRLGPGKIVKYELDVFVSENDSPIFNLGIVNKAVQDAGFVVMNSSFKNDVTYNYEEEHPELVWNKVLETDDSIYYMHNYESDNKIKKYSKIGCREYSGYEVVQEFNEVIRSLKNHVLKPIYINNIAISDRISEKNFKIGDK